MARTNDAYRDAETLAKFSNIDPDDANPLSPRNVENFRHNFSEFLPATLWNVSGISLPSGGIPGPSERAWISLQKLVREAWQNKFGLESCIRVISNISDLSGMQEALKAVTDKIGSDNLVPEYTLPKAEVWPCQRAVLFLGVESWRVRFCTSCGNRYAAAHPPQQFCGDRCFQKSRKEAKRAWWSEHGENLRASKQKSTKKVIKRKKRKA